MNNIRDKVKISEMRLLEVAVDNLTAERDRLRGDLDHYKRLAEAADKYIMVKARNEMIVDTGRQLTDEEHDQQYKAFTEYTSILQEREEMK